MSDNRQERWAFTPDELENPQATNRNDQFVAFPYIDDDGACVEVNREGRYNGQFNQDTVTKEAADAAFDEDCIYKIISESAGFGRQMQTAHQWRDVICTEDGQFVKFVEC